MPEISIASPVGPITLREEKGRIVALSWERPRRRGDDGSDSPLLAEAAEQVAAYFAGRRVAFDLPLGPRGTPYQERVWKRLSRIGFGHTESYGGLARRLGTSPRAVGAACARNPLPILIPCHRVLAGSRGLGGYSGRGGLKTKRYLLRLEGAR